MRARHARILNHKSKDGILMSLATLQRAAVLLNRAKEIIEKDCPDCELKFKWLRDMDDLDKCRVPIPANNGGSENG